jgi:chorismate dehydratase
VLLFSWLADPRELDGRPIALTDHSSTSINLVRVLCEQHYHIAPEWHSYPQDLDRMLAECDGALLIGDRALFEGVIRRHIGRRGLPYCFDLGDEWLKLSGLPFTFAVWAVRRDRADEVRAAGLIPALYDAKAAGLCSIDAIALSYAPRLGLPAGVCAHYLRSLRYHLDARDQQGLQLFLRYALDGFTWSQVQHIEG